MYRTHNNTYATVPITIFLQAVKPSLHPHSTVSAIHTHNHGKPTTVPMQDSLSILMAIFQVNLGQPVPIEAKDNGACRHKMQ